MMIVFIADDDFYPSSDADHTPVSYLRTILPKWKKQMKTSVLKPGSPLLLVLTSSAIRAVQLNRYVLQHSTLSLVHVSMHTAIKWEISVGKILMAGWGILLYILVSMWVPDNLCNIYHNWRPSGFPQSLKSPWILGFPWKVLENEFVLEKSLNLGDLPWNFNW